ncbi:hypothetical protein [Ramlibacter rhizophilus]|uniref:Uncharacterized protein n=1 Tax=Ramlibacter rhizophilus TaxID=1781167 RepID=A0A4Z0BIX6_9BURK|nr:hypothetical protein [Ramlibacter rhizophilus]TFY98701.1 hypothetical protein EZ242_14370 [Ramlibacter rhizophilus]
MKLNPCLVRLMRSALPVAVGLLIVLPFLLALYVMSKTGWTPVLAMVVIAAVLLMGIEQYGRLMEDLRAIEPKSQKQLRSERNDGEV